MLLHQAREKPALGGRKVAKRVEVLRDGKAFLETEVVDAQFLEKVGDSEFAKPD